METVFDYSHYKEPLTEVKGGYGYIGTLAFTKDGEYVQCHICGEQYKNLGGHIYGTHGLRAKEYRQAYSLTSRTSLCSPKYRIERAKEYKRYYEKDGEIIDRASHTEKGREKNLKNRKKGIVKQPKQSLETDNLRGTCPEQMKCKIRKLAERIGKAPTPKEFRKEYNGNGGYEPVIRHFGSWQAAIKACGLKPRSKEIKQKYTDEMLLNYMRQFYEEEGRTPRYSDLENDSRLPNRYLFTKRFGSLNDARKAAGVPILIKTGRHEFIEAMENNYGN